MLGVGKVGNAKVSDLDCLSVRGPEEISGFYVSVNDPLIVDWNDDELCISNVGGEGNSRYSSPRVTSLKIRRVWTTRSVGLPYSSFQRISPPPRYSMTVWEEMC